MDNDEMLVMIKDMFEKSMDKMEKKFDEKVEEVKQHTGTLVEDLRRDVKAIAEGHDILNSKLDKVEADIKGLKSDMAVVKDYVISVDKKLNEHEIILKRVK